MAPTLVPAPDRELEMTVPGALLDGAGIGVATVAWRFLGERQKRRQQARAQEQAEEERANADVWAAIGEVRSDVGTLRRIVDNVMVFLVGKKEQAGLPGPVGFLTQHEQFQSAVMQRLEAIDGHLSATDSRLETIEREWQPNGGDSSYDRLRRIEERGDKGAS